jgi:tRNA A64-2'-O-ribosylphosphate transferase
MPDLTSPEKTSSSSEDLQISASTQSALSSLIFPAASRNIAHTLSALSTRTLSIRNRLHSIDSDAQFVQDVAVAYPECVVIANERCGAWYVEAGLKGRSFKGLSEAWTCESVVRDVICGNSEVEAEVEASRTKTRGSAYFKSTDGHAGQWNFSLKRLNLHVLEALGVYGG